MLKKKVINILLGLTVFLLLLNLVIESIYDKEPREKVPGFSVAEAENRLFNVLNDHGILAEWLKVIQKKIPGQDSLNHIIRITIPKDISLPAFIYDIKKSYPDTINVITHEVKKHGNTSLEIVSKGTNLVNVQLEYDQNISRPCCILSFVLEMPENTDEVDSLIIERNPYPFSFSGIPSFRNQNFKDNLAGTDKDFIVLLSDEIPDKKFKLDAGSTRQVLKGAVRSVVQAFGEDSYYLLDKDSELSKSTSIDYIRNEFHYNNVILNNTDDLIDLRSKEFEEIQSIIKFYCSSTPAEESAVFYMNIDDFVRIEDFLGQFKKKGHKIRKITNPNGNKVSAGG